MVVVAAVPIVQVPWLVRVLAVELPTTTLPSVVRFPVLVIGPLSVNPANPLAPDGPAVRVPSFSRPAETVRVARVVPPLMPTVRVLPDETVSSLTEKPALGTTTVALPEMHASLVLPPLVGTPPLQFSAVFQSDVPAPPVQLSLQDSAAAAGALSRTVRPTPNAVMVPASTTRLARPAPERPCRAP